jgi:hypothetical protein
MKAAKEYLSIGKNYYERLTTPYQSEVAEGFHARHYNHSERIFGPTE